MSDKDGAKMHKLLQASGPSTGRRMTQTNSLQHSKDVEKLKSQVRLCVMRILTERLSKPTVFSKTDNAVITALIVEYLEWMGYNCTLETFQMECRLPAEQNIGILEHLPQLQNNSNKNVLPQIFNIVKMYKTTSD